VDQRVQAEAVGNASNAPVFISYATADRKQALSVCKALERRGTSCWISCRDVAPGENYQEAIVRLLRTTRAVVLVFSGAANNSNEIKKELSLASRYEVPVMALRIEDVEPSDAFAYELSTRQWIDAFDGWDQSIEALVRRIAGLAETDAAAQTPRSVKRHASRHFSRMAKLGAAAAILLVFLAAGMWWLRKPSSDGAHSMAVRLSGFQNLSPDLPSTMPDMIREEIIGAFGDDGVIRASTAAAALAGKGPSYALGGTVRRDGDQIRVITRLTNERSGTTLWTDSFVYDGKAVARVPRRIAVDAGNMVHCGLFAASTYHKPLPDPVMSDYMQFCQNSWWSQQFSNPEKALDSARKVVAALPDFSWGWSAITVAAQQVFFRDDPGPEREEVRRLGLQAADKALALNPKNSEAFAQKSLLIGRGKWVEQEALFKSAIAAQPLFCGCEHFLYGVMLMKVGRNVDAVREMRRSTEMLALDGISQFGLADALLVTGNADEAATHYDAAVDLFRAADTAAYIAISNAPETGDYAAAMKALDDPALRMSKATRAAVMAAFKAMAGGDPHARTRATQALLALTDDEKNSLVARLLSVLGAHREALQILEKRALAEDWTAATWLWYPSMRATLGDPAFTTLIQRLGMINYWRTTHTKPDACSTKGAPPFCGLI
jgi:tetratricopeptide (TPR) repeat protein